MMVKFVQKQNALVKFRFFKRAFDGRVITAECLLHQKCVKAATGALRGKAECKSTWKENRENRTELRIRQMKQKEERDSLKI